jgi:hypothetical protein
MLSPSSRRQQSEETYSDTNQSNGFQAHELAVLPAELPGSALHRELPADSSYQNTTYNENNQPYFEHDPNWYAMQQQRGCFSPSINRYAGVSHMENTSLSFAGPGAPQQTHMPESTYTQSNEPKNLKCSLLSPSPSPNNPTPDSPDGQVSSRMADAVARRHMAPGLNSILTANGYQPYQNNQDSQNNGHHDQLVSPTSTRQSSYGTYNNYPPSQPLHYMTSPSLSRHPDAEHQAPHASSRNTPYSSDHVGQSFFPHPFPFAPQPPINTSMGAAESSSQFNRWGLDPAFSPLTRGSGMHTMMMRYNEPGEEPPPVYSPIPPQLVLPSLPPYCERGIIMQPSSGPEPHGQPPVISISCGYVHCKSTFTGKWAIGNRGRHHKQYHSDVLKWFHCLVDGCNKKFKRDDARRKHERDKHEQLE